MRLAVALLVVLVAGFIVDVDSHTIPLKRKANKFIHHNELGFGQKTALLASGTTIPMDGGLLVLGTYIAPLQVGTPAIEVEMLVSKVKNRKKIKLIIHNANRLIQVVLTQLFQLYHAVHVVMI